MKLSEFSVKHPIPITMILLALLVFGLYSLSLMPLEFMADISMPQAIVWTVYPGASAEDVEQDVTKVLEDNFVTLPHFKSVDSSSYNSVSLITITYADGYDAYDQLEELRNRISELKSELPEGLQGEPKAIVGGVSMIPVVAFTVEAGKDNARVTQFIKDELTPRITQIDGVSQVEIDGGKELEVSIKLNTDELVAKGISVTSVYKILNYGNVNLPLGNAAYSDRAIQVRYAGGFDSIDDIKNLPVGFADGNTIIRLSEVADVSLSYSEPDYYVTDGSNPVILVSVTKRNDGDTVKIADGVKKVLSEVEKETGGSVSFNIVSDDSRQVRASLNTVIKSGVMGVLFAVLVILLFMADWRATITIGISIPLCILFAFIGIKLFGITINLMSLSGMVISLGMVVDGSTVMLEQIYRYYQMRDAETGRSLYTVNQSIYKGWDEVAMSIFASAATTIVVFIPISMLTGLIGKILHAASITIIISIFASFLVAVIIVPYLLKLLLSEKGPKKREKKRKFDIFMDAFEKRYRHLLSLALQNKKFVLVIAVSVLIFSAFTATRLGIAFIPSTDSGDFYISIDFPIGTKISKTREKLSVAQRLLYEKVPEIQTVVFYEGMSNNKGVLSLASPECAYAHVVLVPVSERKRDVHDIMLMMQKVWAQAIPDATVNVENGGFDKLVGYVSGGGGWGMTLISEDMTSLYKTASRIRDYLLTDPDVVNAKLDTDFDTTTMVIDMSQEYLSSLGLSSYEAGITSGILFQGMDAGRYKDAESGTRYKLRLSSDITDRNLTADDISDIHIITDRGQNVSFANLSDIRVEKSISQINHSDRAKTITVSATLTGEDTAAVSRRVSEYLSQNPLPSDVGSKSGGIVALVSDMIPPMMTALAIAIFLVYMVMVLQFEKFKQPLIIMVTIPFCFIGVVVGLLMFGSTMNLLALLGLVSLAGVVVNNGIILVDYINQLRVVRREEIAREKGEEDRDGQWHVDLTSAEEIQLLHSCVLDGASSRIRPILITTLTTLLGDIPMALSRGEGAELYAPMGQAIVGGLLTSTLITLVLIPLLYFIIEQSDIRKSERIAKVKARIKKRLSRYKTDKSST